MNDWGIHGHEWVRAYLEKTIADGKDSHAYLLWGPPHIGKTLLALRLAQALMCHQPGAAPCRTCSACKRIERGNHPDVRIAGMHTQAAGLKADEAARQKVLRIATIRAWQADIALRPYEGQRRIFLLHDAERMTEESSNALLKTLEEPPPYATLILVANTADLTSTTIWGEESFITADADLEQTVNLLPTVVSRCQILRLRPLSRTHVQSALQARDIPPDQATLLAAWSEGRIGWALRMLDTPEEIASRIEQRRILRDFHPPAGQRAKLHPAAMHWIEARTHEYRSGDQALVFAWLDLWHSWWRDILLFAADNVSAVRHIDCLDDLQQDAARYSMTDIISFLRRIGQTARQLRENVSPQLALEHLLLHIP